MSLRATGGRAFAGDGRHGSIVMNSSFGGRWGV
jgi:hypothetical protein